MPEPDELEVTFTILNPTCLGNDGSIIAIASGGTSPYNYAWYTGETDPTITGLAAGPSTAQYGSFSRIRRRYISAQIRTVFARDILLCVGNLPDFTRSRFWCREGPTI